MRRALLAAFSVALPSAGLLFFGCSDDAPPAEQDAATLDARGDAAAVFTPEALAHAAAVFNQVYCPAFQRCDGHHFELTFGPGDAGADHCQTAGGLVTITATEVRRVEDFGPSGNVVDIRANDLRYADDLEMPYGHGSVLTPAALEACSEALAAQLSNCAGWVALRSERRYPRACEPAFKGFLAEGAACGAWNQCASGRCLLVPGADDGACGTCFEERDAGASCLPEQCGAGLSCRDDTCVPFGDAGASCARNAPCREDFLCSGGTCVPGPDGGPCDPAAGCPAVPRFSACTAGNTCAPTKNADPDGGRCGIVEGAPLGYVNCPFGSTCALGKLSPPDAAPGYFTYACTPTLHGHGEACSAAPGLDSPCAMAVDRCYHDICQSNGPAECSRPSGLLP